MHLFVGTYRTQKNQTSLVALLRSLTHMMLVKCRKQRLSNNKERNAFFVINWNVYRTYRDCVEDETYPLLKRKRMNV
ncbi:unnamed protein product [Onchocerca flexuosa]|uniref:Y1_Tnp domain-containing protein n=1 Tax=Onchocerca flexuosa TaxID=387005 RepID=A0A183I1M6_9BILA|nr:unnamed protein product [Onchocerca flexuosa]